jgi:hypothetical protein
MFRKLLIVFAVACSDDLRYDVVQCHEIWGGGRCESACRLKPSNQDATGEDAPCMASHPDVSYPIQCDRTFEADGERGCCKENVDPNIIANVSFWTCE